MITELMRDDHDAGREIFAVAGNSPFEGTDERETALAHLARLWSAHGAMMEEVVLPVLDAVAESREGLHDIRLRQEAVSSLAAELARRADWSNDQDLGHDPSLWYADFERLKAEFEAQCLTESATLIPMIQNRLDPEAIAALTRAAREVRLRAGV